MDLNIPNKISSIEKSVIFFDVLGKQVGRLGFWLSFKSLDINFLFFRS